MTNQPPPETYIVDALGANAFAVIRVSDRRRMGTYPNVDHAQRVADDFNKTARREWVKARTIKQLHG